MALPKKRKSRGRSKGSKGRSEYVTCTSCGARVPRDKAKKVTVRVPLVDSALAKEMQAKGAVIPYTVATKYYCISCAVHMGIVKVRSRDERRSESVR
jgi:small subunit ribosomal protein S26e